VTLPSPVTFVPATDMGVATVPVTFTVDGWFTLWVNDTVDTTLTNYTIAWVVASVGLDHFEVTGIEDMWEGNSSDVTVTAIDDYGTVFEDYTGTIVWSTNASLGADIPTTTVFTAGDMGTVTLIDAVSFDEPGVFNVTVEDQTDPTKRGTQEDIVIIDLYAASLMIEGAPVDTVTARSFSLTVSVYDQFDNLFSEYTGTVSFSTSDADAGIELPEDYTFDAMDAGTHDFTGEFTLITLGAQTVTAEDEADGALTDTVSIEVLSPEGMMEMVYTVSDMFQEPMGDWWAMRLDSSWPTDYPLTTTVGDVTYLYNPEENFEQGLVYSPYRWNIDANNLTLTYDYKDAVTGDLIPKLFNVHHPEFMYVANEGTEEAGAETTVDIYNQYMDDAWWDDYWTPYWGSDPDWPKDNYFDVPVNRDGWVVGSLINVTMNRAAAEEWMGLPATESDVDGWWVDNEGTYADEFSAWLDLEGNDRLNIWPGYEYTLAPLVMMYVLTELPSGDVKLEIGMLSWGYEVMLVRWLRETTVCDHEVYWEDLALNISYSEGMANLTFDAVGVYSMHAVEQNGSSSDLGAWVWEPTRIDYVYSTDPVSEYNPYSLLDYESHNCGDPMMDTPVPYEATPQWFNLTEYQRLVFEMPTGDNVMGYYGSVVPSTAIEDVSLGDTSAYDDIRYYGYVTLGYNTLGSVPYTWDNGTKVLTIEGPWDFDNNRWPSGALYHGAPWIEFDVTPVTKSASMQDVPVTGEPASAGAAASTELVSLGLVWCVVVLLTAMIAVLAVRSRET